MKPLLSKGHRESTEAMTEINATAGISASASSHFSVGGEISFLWDLAGCKSYPLTGFVAPAVLSSRKCL